MKRIDQSVKITSTSKYKQVCGITSKAIRSERLWNLITDMCARELQELSTVHFCSIGELRLEYRDGEIVVVSRKLFNSQKRARGDRGITPIKIRIIVESLVSSAITAEIARDRVRV